MKAENLKETNSEDRKQFRVPQLFDNGKITELTAGGEEGDDEFEDRKCIVSPVRLVPRD
jgi:hypothetical protein